ncbi:cache domain-containing protein [Candidatus Nitrosotenuis sp. DW1]|uniref:cache domain-containing protein n=1 Tax=Candidatus Nitrosotenuis sp. DW1 TaxID=2259672 RepID=UPI0015CA0213|nr:cache domain-containing protein [Candidatus Nitrosotenuis sp. DW1]
MRISYLLIASITVLFLIYAIHSYFTYDFTVNEAKKTTLFRNQAQANNIMQDLDKYIDQKITNFHSLTQIKQIQLRVIESNRHFDPNSDLNELNSQIDAITDSKETPFLNGMLKNEISDELRDFASAYNDQYGYAVIKELFVTNQYGANIALAIGKSDYIQTDEEWWQITKNKQIYVGPMEFDSDYNDHIITFAYPILDDSSDYIGTLSVSVSFRVLLQEFVNDADVVNAAKKTVVLLDENGNVLFENGNFFPTETPKEYFSDITLDNGSFEYVLASPTFISYASSIGYKDFRGLGWTVVIEQESSVIDEFEELEKNFLVSTLIGIISAAILGVTLSYFVTSPLGKLSKLTTRLGKGDFEAKPQKARLPRLTR